MIETRKERESDYEARAMKGGENDEQMHCRNIHRHRSLLKTLSSLGGNRPMKVAIGC